MPCNSQNRGKVRISNSMINATRLTESPQRRMKWESHKGKISWSRRTADTRREIKALLLWKRIIHFYGHHWCLRTLQERIWETWRKPRRLSYSLSKWIAWSHRLTMMCRIWELAQTSRTSFLSYALASIAALMMKNSEKCSQQIATTLMAMEASQPAKASKIKLKASVRLLERSSSSLRRKTSDQFSLETKKAMGLKSRETTSWQNRLASATAKKTRRWALNQRFRPGSHQRSSL